MKLVVSVLLLIIVKLSVDERWSEAASPLKFETKQESKDNNVCPGGTVCPGDQTCCPIGGGDYGCCPFANAVCCSDMRHCCPEGKRCNLSAGTCDSSPEKILPWGGKQ